MTEELKLFIEDNIALIEQDKWEEVYQKAKDDIYNDIGKFTEIMFEADIHPEMYLKELPYNFLRDSDIKEFEIPSNIKSIGHYAF